MTYLVVSLYLGALLFAVVLWMRNWFKLQHLVMIALLLGIAASNFAVDRKALDLAHERSVRQCVDTKRLAGVVDSFHSTLKPFMLTAVKRLGEQVRHESGAKRRSDLAALRTYQKLASSIKTAKVTDCHVRIRKG